MGPSTTTGTSKPIRRMRWSCASGMGGTMGLWAKTVSVANPSVEPPLLPLDDHDAPRLIEPCCLKAAKQPCGLDQPLQKHTRAARVPVVVTRRLVALATAYRLPCEREASGGEVE